MPSVLMDKRGTALLSVAAGDRQGLASPETLEAVDTSPDIYLRRYHKVITVTL